MVRTSPFHGGNRGSNPLGVTKPSRLFFNLEGFFTFFTEVTQNRKTACHARESGHPLCKNKRKNGFPLSWE